MAGRATYPYLLCVAFGNVSDIHRAIKVIILSPDYSRVLLSSGKNLLPGDYAHGFSNFFRNYNLILWRNCDFRHSGTYRSRWSKRITRLIDLQLTTSQFSSAPGFQRFALCGELFGTNSNRPMVSS